MQIKRNISIFIGILVVVCLLNIPSVFAAYSYSLDRFQLTGPSNIDDHFDDGILDSGFWEVDDPTVTETGTTVTFSNPGISDQFSLGSLNILSEMSYISTVFTSTNWVGDFQATSTWNGTISGSNQIYLMNLSTGSADEDIILGVANWGIEMSAFFGAPTGPSIFFGRVNDIGSGDFNLQSISINSSDISGSILLSIAFNDSLDLFSGSYSLDSTTNFISPFSSVASLNGGFRIGDWSLGSESFEIQSVPVPSSVILLFLGLSLQFFHKKR